MSKYPTALIPFTKLSPKACIALVAALDDAIELFDKWELPTGINTKLGTAKKQLLKVITDDSYGKNDDELFKTARAITLANDFYLISRILSGTRAKAIAEELENALKGTLDEIETTKKNSTFDFQTQFWFGTVLAHSNVHLSVPDIVTTKPDFVIKHGSLLYGVEIKRPKSLNGVKNSLGKAATQLRNFGKPGIIVLDLTCALEIEKYILYKGKSPVRELVEYQLRTVTNELKNYIIKYSRSDKFNRIVLLVTYIRFFNWTIGKKDDADMGELLILKVFPEACSGLVVDESVRIQKLILNGFGQIRDYLLIR